MLLRAMLVWLALLLLAIANGGLRESVLLPRMGTASAHAWSTITLSVAIAVTGWLTVPWIRPASAREAWLVGLGWMLLTVAFEFLAGRFLFHRPWQVLLADYNLAAGRIWILVLLVLLVTPVLVHGCRR